MDLAVVHNHTTNALSLWERMETRASAERDSQTVRMQTCPHADVSPPEQTDGGKSVGKRWSDDGVFSEHELRTAAVTTCHTLYK